MKTRLVIVGGAVLVLLAGAFSYVFFGGKAGANALASVNGEKITVDLFLQEIEKIQEPTRGMFKEDPANFLEMMIMKALLLQEVRRQGSQPGKEAKGEDEAIQEFLQKKFSSPPAVSREELAAFYEIYKDRMGGKSLEEMAPMIEQVIRQGKQEEQYVQFLKDIRDKATVEINRDRLQAIAVKAPESNTAEEFSAALKSSKPVLVDFGSNTCVPCRQLRPILQEIKKEQAGKMEVLVIDVYKHQDLSREYRVQVIPTLVFFDASGKEVLRHQGFMPKTALLEELKKVGIS